MAPLKSRVLQKIRAYLCSWTSSWPLLCLQGSPLGNTSDALCPCEWGNPWSVWHGGESHHRWVGLLHRWAWFAVVTHGKALKIYRSFPLPSPSFFLSSVHSFKTESHITLTSLELAMEDQAGFRFRDLPASATWVLGYYTLQQVNSFPLLVLWPSSLFFTWTAFDI